MQGDSAIHPSPPVTYSYILKLYEQNSKWLLEQKQQLMLIHVWISSHVDNHKHIVYGRRQLAFQRMSYINYANCVFWLHANSVISSARGKLITVRTRATIDDWAIGQFHRRTYSFKRNVMSVLDSFLHYFDLIWQRWCVKTQRTNKHKHQSIFY